MFKIGDLVTLTTTNSPRFGRIGKIKRFFISHKSAYYNKIQIDWGNFTYNYAETEVRKLTFTELIKYALKENNVAI